MANVSTFSLVVPITGDNAATSCVISLGYTPATAAATAAYDATGNSALANIASVVPGTMNVTVNFVAAFSGTIQVILSLSNSNPTPGVGIGLPFSAQVTTKQQVKGSGGSIASWSVLNTTSAIAYVQVFNALAANVTLGSTTPDWVIPVPANGSTGAGTNGWLPFPILHSTGITIACTTTRTGSTTAACDVLLFFN